MKKFFEDKFTRIKNRLKYKFIAKIPYLEFHVCDNCNLNCAGCTHFSPIAENEAYLDIEQFKKDIKMLAEKLLIRKIRIMGGEPLLNPDLCEIIKITRSAYPYSDIRLVTNGLLLPSMDKTFWQTLRNNGIIMDITKYPASGAKFAEYLDLCDDNGIKAGHIHLAKRLVKFFNLKGDADKDKNSKFCINRLRATLWHSKLYKCPACYLETADNYWNLNLPKLQPIDFCKLSGSALKKKLAAPSDVCARCNALKPPAFEWKKSENTVSDFFTESASG